MNYLLKSFLRINYAEDRDFLMYMLKDLKVSKKEYNFWKSLGLIKNEREMELDNEIKSNKEKVKFNMRRK